MQKKKIIKVLNILFFPHPLMQALSLPYLSGGPGNGRQQNSVSKSINLFLVKKL